MVSESTVTRKQAVGLCLLRWCNALDAQELIPSIPGRKWTSTPNVLVDMSIFPPVCLK